jgi:CDP-ribitol ribitolphosphotransferase
MKKCPEKVAIISRESDSKTLDIAMLEAELRRRGADVKVLSKLLTKEKSLKNALGYVGHVLKQETAILGSDVVVLDTYCIPASMIPHRKGTKVVQMWHALGAIKQFGWQTVGKAGGSSPRVARVMRMHHGYDYVVCPSDITAEHFSEAFRTDRGKVVKYGLPRIDYVKSVALGDRRDEMRAKIFAKYPQLVKAVQKEAPQKSQKKTVLYAPTFRRGKAVDVQSLAEALDPEKYDLVVKLHPLYRADASQSSRTNVIYDDEFSSYDWLAVADIIISDYSSYVIESTLADKPLYIYAYDLEDYAKNTGLNIDFDSEPIAPYVFRDAKALAESIGKGYDPDALRAFRDRYIDINTDNCTADLAEFILSLAKK